MLLKPTRHLSLVGKLNNAKHPNGRNLSYADFKITSTTPAKRLYISKTMSLQASSSKEVGDGQLLVLF